MNAAKKHPKRMYVVWCDGGWSAFTSRKTALYWSQDKNVLVYEPARTSPAPRGRS